MELDVTQPLLLPAGERRDRRRLGGPAGRDPRRPRGSERHLVALRPDRDGADPHIHRHHTDLFYVLEGELTIGLGADRQETVVPAGTLVLAPPFVVHAFRNGSAADVRYLNFHAPGAGFADYLRGRQPGSSTRRIRLPTAAGRVEEALIVPAERGRCSPRWTRSASRCGTSRARRRTGTRVLLRPRGR